MELFQLRYFLTVARYENFSKAADELHISQPSVSKAVKLLETELGSALFERKGKRIELNNAGRVLQERLKGIMGALDNLPNEMRVASGAKESTIAFNVLATSSLLPDILSKFKKEQPLINFYLTQEHSVTKFDLCITATLPDILPNNGALVLGEDIKLAVPLTSPLSMCESVDLRDLKQERFLMLNKNYRLRAIMSHFFDLCGYSPNIAFESDNPHTLRDLVEVGLGVSLWPELSWGKIQRHKAKLIHIRNPVCRRNISVTWPENKEMSPEVKTFLRFLKSYFKDLQYEQSGA